MFYIALFCEIFFKRFKTVNLSWCCVVMKRARITCHLLLLFLFILPIQAMKVPEDTLKDTLYVQVRFQLGYSSVDTLFGDNKIHLEHLVLLLNNAASDSSAIIKSITIKGCASPEGYTPMNRKLSEKRAQNVRTYILNKTHLADSIVKVAPSDVDWELLSKMIATTDQPWRDEAIEIIANTPIWIFDKDNRIIDGRKNRLCMLRGGRAWNYMKEKFFPDMRNARFRIICEREMLVVETPDQTPVASDQDSIISNQDLITQVPDTADVHVPVSSSEVISTTTIPPTEKEHRRMKALLKTNMLYDIAAIPNIGIEVAIGQRWSVGANWMYAWWSNDAKHRYWRVYGGDVELRTRLGRVPRASVSPFAGHHLGVYASMVTYDLQFGNRTGVIGDKYNYAAGISYGYSLPITHRLNLDFTAGVGYAWGKYKKHHPMDGHDVWISTHRLKRFGPTRLEIGLQWLLGKDNHNARKGGRK